MIGLRTTRQGARRKARAEGTTPPHEPEDALRPRSLMDLLALGVESVGIEESADFADFYCRYFDDTERRAFADFLTQFLEYDPKERASAGLALHHTWFEL